MRHKTKTIPALSPWKWFRDPVHEFRTNEKVLMTSSMRNICMICTRVCMYVILYYFLDKKKHKPSGSHTQRGPYSLEDKVDGSLVVGLRDSSLQASIWGKSDNMITHHLVLSVRYHLEWSLQVVLWFRYIRDVTK